MATISLSAKQSLKESMETPRRVAPVSSGPTPRSRPRRQTMALDSFEGSKLQTILQKYAKSPSRTDLSEAKLSEPALTQSTNASTENLKTAANQRDVNMLLLLSFFKK